MKYLAIDVGGTFIKYALIDEEGRLYVKDKVPTEKESLEKFVDLLVDLYNRFSDEVEGIAICAPGMIDSERGFMYNGGALSFIRNINIVEILESRCKVPVTVENDAKCAALAEVWKGSLSDCKNAVAVILGTGVGGAVIVDRKVLRGKHFMAGEFSYLFPDMQNWQAGQTLGNCGGVPGFIRLVEEKKKLEAGTLDGEKVFSMANQGDAEAIECLKQYCRNLAVQLSNYQFIIDPEKIAIGGGISAQPILLETIKEALREINAVFPYPVPVPDVVTCKFFNDSNLIGALYVHLKAREEKIDVNKVEEFINFIGDRREKQYVKELFMS